jgi:ATP-grasp domain/L-amino acid ligase C-terminal domain 2/ATP-grasp N-terminal domain
MGLSFVAMDETTRKNLLILCTTTGYQTAAFAEAAATANVRVFFGSDRCHVLQDPWRDGAIPLRFDQPDECALRIAEFARTTPIHAIVALGDRPTAAAACAGRMLGLPCHPPDAVRICADKYQSRTCLAAAGVKVPHFQRFLAEDDSRRIVASEDLNGRRCGADISFPCVLKPLALSTSRGVIRADNPDEFTAAFERIRRLLDTPDLRGRSDSASGYIQVEEYLEGAEIAAEAVVERGQLHVLAIFDKPDPLNGPFFEETIYVTPSRLPAASQRSVAQTLEQAVAALGLFHGPVHAEFRLNAKGVWVLEIAARSIGGLCSRALRFHHRDLDRELSLEEVLIRIALDRKLDGLCREDRASGVMMIPVPGEGILEDVVEIQEALGVAGVEDIVITAKRGERLVPLPEGSSYPGFIFARAQSPERVETALRQAHQKLRFRLARSLPVLRQPC